MQKFAHVLNVYNYEQLEVAPLLSYQDFADPTPTTFPMADKILQILQKPGI